MTTRIRENTLKGMNGTCFRPKLLLYHNHQIKIIPMHKRLAAVLDVAYAKANLQAETREVTFYRTD